MSVERNQAGRHRAGLLMLMSIWLVIVAVFAGCSDGVEKTVDQTVVQPAIKRESRISETKQDDFVYRLVIEQPAEGTGGKPTLSAELEYVGDKDEMTIYHAASPFSYFVKETTHGYELLQLMDQPLIATSLKREVPFRETYAGGIADPLKKDDVKLEEFAKAVRETGFPPGQYEVTGVADFYTELGGMKKDYRLKTTITFAVD